MSQTQSGFTKQMARNMFFGGTVFFGLVFAGLIFDSERRIPERSNAQNITESVVRGKHVWETNNCIGWATCTSAVARTSSKPGFAICPPRAYRVAARCRSST